MVFSTMSDSEKKPDLHPSVTVDRNEGASVGTPENFAEINEWMFTVISDLDSSGSRAPSITTAARQTQEDITKIDGHEASTASSFDRLSLKGSSVAQDLDTEDVIGRADDVTPRSPITAESKTANYEKTVAEPDGREITTPFSSSTMMASMAKTNRTMWSSSSDSRISGDRLLSCGPIMKIFDVMRGSLSDTELTCEAPVDMNEIEKCCDLCDSPGWLVNPGSALTPSEKVTSRGSSDTSVVTYSKTSMSDRSSLDTGELHNKQTSDTDFDASKQRVFGVNRWAGFGKDNNQEVPKYHRMSGLLEMKTDASNLMAGDSAQDNDNSRHDEMNAAEQRHVAAAELPNSPIKALSPALTDSSNGGIEPMDEDHGFPCLCPDSRCDGKRSPVWKKDNRTWLWKSKETRNAILNIRLL